MRLMIGDKSFQEVLKSGREIVSNDAKKHMQMILDQYQSGLSIQLVQLQDVLPPKPVSDSFNEVNRAKQEQESVINEARQAYNKEIYKVEGDAQRILIVERAKAEAESKRLQGQGIADQRREIARGLEDSVKVLNGVDINSQEASALIVVTQHYDTLQSVGAEANSNLILMPNSPQAGSEMLNNMVASFTASNQIGEEMKKARSQKKGKEPK